jgi:hypothetical protein
MKEGLSLEGKKVIPSLLERRCTLLCRPSLVHFFILLAK